MNLRSKILPLLLALCPIWAWAGNGPTPDLLSVVPAGDITYSRLEQLASAGFISPKDLASSLTRFDVVALIQKAEVKEGEIVLAQGGEISATSSNEDEIGPNSAAELNAPSPGDRPGRNSPCESHQGPPQPGESLPVLN